MSAHVVSQSGFPFDASARLLPTQAPLASDAVRPPLDGGTGVRMVRGTGAELDAEWLAAIDAATD